MKRLILAGLAALGLVSGFVPAADAAAPHNRVQVGRLSCDVAPGVGLLIGSQKPLVCVFRRDGFPPEQYRGTISKLGIDIGVTAATHIEWVVFTATNTRYSRHSLAGSYVGGSAEATLGVGLGANWLIGGSRRSYALQPVSIQAQAGLNYSVALANLQLY
jgi:hypothetical protein